MLLFNPAATLEVVRFDESHFCLVVDNALINPGNIVQFAADNHAKFKPVDFNFYPGTYLMATPVMTSRMTEFFQFHARRLFDARRCLHTNLRYSMVTRPADALHPFQWLCHRDDAGLPPGMSMQASVLYLFDNMTLGGTAFYVPIRSAEETRGLFTDAGNLSPGEFANKYSLKSGYMEDSNAWFRRIGSVDAKWNRLIIYDGSMFHTGDIHSPERLSDDPRTGRLTLNGFFTSRRNVGTVRH